MNHGLQCSLGDVETLSEVRPLDFARQDVAQPGVERPGRSHHRHLTEREERLRGVEPAPQRHYCGRRDERGDEHGREPARYRAEDVGRLHRPELGGVEQPGGDDRHEDQVAEE